MRKTTLAICLFIGVISVQAQESKWGMSLTPAIIQSPDMRLTLQPGIEYRINDRLSILTDFGFDLSKHNDSSFTHTRYFRVKPEIRYSFLTLFKDFNLYAGFQSSFTYRKWENLDGGFFYASKSAQDSVISFSKAVISSPVFTSSLQFGASVTINRHLFIDLFAGAGIRLIVTHYSQLENQIKEDYNRPVCRIVPAPDPAYWTRGSVSRFHSNFGARLLYRF